MLLDGPCAVLLPKEDHIVQGVVLAHGVVDLGITQHHIMHSEAVLQAKEKETGWKGLNASKDPYG